MWEFVKLPTKANLIKCKSIFVRKYTDNKGVQPIIENNASRRRTRYIDMKYLFVLDFYRLGYCTFPRVTFLINYSDFRETGVRQSP